MRRAGRPGTTKTPLTPTLCAPPTLPLSATGINLCGWAAWQNRKLAFLEAASLYLDGREDVAAQADGLAALGHLVTVPEAPINIANPVMLCVDPETGEMEAAGDPLAGRHAAALP